MSQAVVLDASVVDVVSVELAYQLKITVIYTSSGRPNPAGSKMSTRFRTRKCDEILINISEAAVVGFQQVTVSYGGGQRREGTLRRCRSRSGSHCGRYTQFWISTYKYGNGSFG